MALTLLVGVLRPADGHIDLICAGHENPLLASADGQVRELALRGGPPLCVDASFPYAVESMVLRPGETLLAFSDGLTEAQTAEGRLWPRARTAGGGRPGREGAERPRRWSTTWWRRSGPSKPAPSPATT